MSRPNPANRMDWFLAPDQPGLRHITGTGMAMACVLVRLFEPETIRAWRLP